MDKFCWIPSHLVSAFSKCNVNLGSLLLMIFLGNLYHGLRYSWATPAPKMWMEHSRNMAALKHPWSTMVRMASSPLCIGSPMIRSMATTWNGGMFSSVGMQYRGVPFLWVRIFACWHVAHPLTYSVTQSLIPGHQ